MIQDALRKVTERKDLTQEEAMQVMTALMEGQATEAQMGGLLGALRTKRESVEELSGFVRVMRDKSVKVPSRRRPLIDMCGTGDRKSTRLNSSHSQISYAVFCLK